MAQGPHVVQTVREFDQNDPHIFRHGKDHLTHIFGLVLETIAEGQFFQLGNAFNQHQNGGTEGFFQFFSGDSCILQNIVQ